MRLRFSRRSPSGTHRVLRHDAKAAMAIRAGMLWEQRIPKEGGRLAILRGRRASGSADWRGQRYPAMGTREELKRLRELHHRKGRAEQGRFLVQGPKLVMEAAGSGWPIEAVHVCEAARDRWASLSPTVWPQHVMDRIGTLESGNEVVAVLRLPPTPPLHAPATQELVLALDGIADPGNLGTMIRTALAAGATAVAACGGADPFHPKAVRAAAGAGFRLPILRDRADALRARLGAHGVRIMVADPRAAVDYGAAPLDPPVAVVVGNEARGPSPAWADAGLAVRIPHYGPVESLNAAAAAAVLLYEVARRRARR
jgi:TrmH family RNA methyltransferase